MTEEKKQPALPTAGPGWLPLGSRLVLHLPPGPVLIEDLKEALGPLFEVTELRGAEAPK